MSDDARMVQRQAFAGLLWGKQSYHYDVRAGLKATRRSRRPLLSDSKGVITIGSTCTIPT